MKEKDKALQILQHALGLDEFGRGKEHRSHFVTSTSSSDWSACMEHTEEGRMYRRGPSPMYGGPHSYCFVVTDAGREYVREHSPEPPKLTSSQKRYQDYLAADSPLTFGEWLRARGSR